MELRRALPERPAMIVCADHFVLQLTDMNHIGSQ
jgi:hypothetical protein